MQRPPARLADRSLGLPFCAQVAVVFSKVARFDFPKAWPTLFSDLLAKLQVRMCSLGHGQLCWEV